jgi:hypothetical protein
MKLGFSRQIFEKSPNIKFLKNPASESRVAPCGRTEGQAERYYEANWRFPQFCEGPNNA